MSEGKLAKLLEPHKDSILSAVERITGISSPKDAAMSSSGSAPATPSSSRATRVLLADKLAPNVTDWLAADGFGDARTDLFSKSLFDVRMDAGLKDDSLLAAMKEYNPEILVVRSTKVTAAQLRAAPALALVIRAGSGFNTIDVPAASAMGIFVANCPGKNARAVAELALGHLIACDRGIAANTSEFKQKRWDKNTFGKDCSGLCGRRMAILGMGEIGRLMAKYCKALGMSVVGFSRSLTKKDCEEIGIDYAVSPTDLVTGADALSIHLPATSLTKGMVDASLLSFLNDGAIIINTSRGEVVNEADLLKLAEEKKFKIGLDVYCNEPGASDKELKPESYPMAESDRIFSATHHIGASTDQAEESVGEEVCRIIASFADKGEVPNCVNLQLDTLARYAVVIRHADKVGVLAAVLTEFSKVGLNIEQMQNIVFRGGEAACAKLEVSDKPDDGVIGVLLGHEHIFSIVVNKIAHET
jgi:D-3-phosphoglycerate dehydrogenase